MTNASANGEPNIAQNRNAVSQYTVDNLAREKTGEISTEDQLKGSLTATVKSPVQEVGEKELENNFFSSGPHAMPYSGHEYIDPSDHDVNPSVGSSDYNVNPSAGPSYHDVNRPAGSFRYGQNMSKKISEVYKAAPSDTHNSSLSLDISSKASSTKSLHDSD